MRALRALPLLAVAACDWLHVGAKAGTGGLPAAYSASSCGATFTP